MPAARRRFVVFADKFDYNITSVPPEWHGWLNYMNDYEPTHHDFKKPVYHVRAGAALEIVLCCTIVLSAWLHELHSPGRPLMQN